MRGSRVKLLLCAVIFLALICEIEGPSSRGRGRERRKSKTLRSIEETIGTATTGILKSVRALSPSASRASRQEATPSRSGSRGLRSLSGLGSRLGYFSRSRRSNKSPSSSPQRSPPQPQPAQPQPEFFNPPLPWIPVSITVTPQDMLPTLEQNREFEGKHLVPTQLKNGKAALLDKASVDICNEDRNHGDDQCATNLREFQEFPKKWRGARGDAFTAMCQLWGTMGWKCSFFIKTSQGLDQPLAGYVHRMEDCVKDVKVDAYREAWRLRVVGS
ncbi:unnamed protein product [Bemisia tabaci]|uniref:Uncharacterized protein n=1 Tax=Bemisia tabaci TaxID=7038 RepID=A0A9P0A1Y7_BEMTA|nr:unnamed protein product [Bemisia tabaci]